MMKRFPTLEAIDMEWVVKLHTLETAVFIAGIAGNFLLALWRPQLLGLGFGIGFTLAMSISLAQRFCFYNLVRCPNCGQRLNRFKNGKKVPSKQAYTQLGNGYGCRNCSWKPSSPQPEHNGHANQPDA